MSYVVLLLIVSVLYTQTEGQTYASVNNLKQILLKNYITTTLPVINQTSSINVTARIVFRGVRDFDIVKGVLTTKHIFNIEWKDELIRWNPEQNDGVKEMRLSFGEVWTPTIGIINALKDYDLTATDSNALSVNYYYTGQASILFPVFILSTCEVYVKYFPFDTHSCSIQVTTNGYSKKSINLLSGGIDTSKIMSNSQWDISVSNLISVNSASGGSFLTTEITLDRRPQFLILNIFVPILFLLLINFFVSVLPSDCGEKVSFCTTVLLSLAIYMTIIMDQLPPISNDFPVVSLLLCINLANSMSMCIAAIFSVYFHYQSDFRKIPQILYFLSLIVNLTNYKNPNAVTGDSVIKLDTDEYGIDTISNRNNTKDLVKAAQRPSLTWAIVSRSIDKISLITCIVITFVEIFMAWYYMRLKP